MNPGVQPCGVYRTAAQAVTAVDVLSLLCQEEHTNEVGTLTSPTLNRQRSEYITANGTLRADLDIPSGTLDFIFRALVRVPPGPLQEHLETRRKAMLDMFGPWWLKGSLARDLNMTGLMDKRTATLHRALTWVPTAMYQATSGKEVFESVSARKVVRKDASPAPNEVGPS